MPNTPIQDAVDFASTMPGTAGNGLAGFIAAYFDKTDPEELLARGSATLFAIANAHHRQDSSV
jgi:glutamate dehydrogenase